MSRSGCAIAPARPRRSTPLPASARLLRLPRRLPNPERFRLTTPMNRMSPTNWMQRLHRCLQN
eukprot:12902301-Prorocentrum_lima.AAC.1